MSKNYMEQVAQMLGVEIGEKFYVVDETNLKVLVRMTERGIIDDGGAYRSEALRYLICGEYKVQKIPKRKHTGLEDVQEDEWIYPLFDDVLNGMKSLKERKLAIREFSDKKIRDNWARYISIKKRLAKAASELNDGPIDWTIDGQEKWCIYYSVYSRDLDFISTYTVNDDGIYFTSKAAARKAVEIVGEKDLIWMLRDFQPFIGYLAEVTESE